MMGAAGTLGVPSVRGTGVGMGGIAPGLAPRAVAPVGGAQGEQGLQVVVVLGAFGMAVGCAARAVEMPVAATRCVRVIGAVVELVQQRTEPHDPDAQQQQTQRGKASRATLVRCSLHAGPDLRPAWGGNRAEQRLRAGQDHGAVLIHG
jgi:hypothetical protein